MRSKEEFKEAEAPIRDGMTANLKKFVENKVDHPSHYNTGKFEAIEVIEDWKLGFNLGNTIKYLSRAGKKDPAKHLEDLEKAAWYLKREIDNLKNNK